MRSVLDTVLFSFFIPTGYNYSSHVVYRGKYSQKFTTPTWVELFRSNVQPTLGLVGFFVLFRRLKTATIIILPCRVILSKTTLT